MTKEELRLKISEVIQKDGKINKVGGALGDMAGCTAYVEETRKDPMWQTKYLGVSYWYKGITDNDIIDRVTLTKRAFVEVFKLLLPILPFVLVFQRQKLINSLWKINRSEGGLKARTLDVEGFSPVCFEIIRAIVEVMRKKMEKSGGFPHRPIENAKLIELIFCTMMFLQFSPSYRIRVQDFFEILDKERLKKAFLRELWRVMRVMRKREFAEKKKMDFLLGLVMLLAILFRGTVYKFLMEINIDTVKFDEADWYFCLRRHCYDFRGIPLHLRLEEAQRIDFEKDHCILGI